MASDSPSSSQCATCLPVPFSATFPLSSSRLCLCRPSNLGPSSSRLQLWALSSVGLLWVATFLSDTLPSPLIRPSALRRRFSPPFSPIWLPLRGRLGLPMLLLCLLLLESSLLVGYAYFLHWIIWFFVALTFASVQFIVWIWSLYCFSSLISLIDCWDMLRTNADLNFKLVGGSVDLNYITCSW